MRQPHSRPVFSLCASLVCCCVLAAGCGREDMQSKSSVSASAPSMEVAQAGEMAAAMSPMPAGAAGMRAAGNETADASLPSPIPRKIIYTATVNLVAETLSETARKLAESVKAHGGYIAETNISGAAGSQRTATWKLRVPVPQFDAFMASLGTLGELQDSATTSQDVSEEFYDMAARLQNKKVEETRLIQHLQKSTGKLTEILAVEREISRVREEIERMEGRLRFLSNQSELSTVTVTIREIKDYVPPSPPSFATEIARTFSGSVRALTVAAKTFVLLLVGLLPWALPVSLLVAGILYWDRSSKRRKNSIAAALQKRDRSSGEYDNRSGP